MLRAFVEGHYVHNLLAQLPASLATEQVRARASSLGYFSNFASPTSR